MVDRPILFSGPMVRALLDGRKTQTRRELYSLRAIKDGLVPRTAAIATGVDKNGVQFAYQFPRTYGVDRYYAISPWFSVRKGDRLWVRESWLKPFANTDTGSKAERAGYIYRADGPEYLDRAAQKHQWGKEAKWKVSIHMPREASRLTLTVTDVRVERLQSISKNDVMAEGCHERDGLPLVDVHAGWHEPYAALWDKINGVGAWEVNPWVVAVTFTVEHRNIDA